MRCCFRPNVDFVEALIFTILMKNSKWSKLVSKEAILKIKEQENFNFSIINLAKHFNIPGRRMSELIKYYEIEITRLTKNI